jgi:hypothetical protein
MRDDVATVLYGRSAPAMPAPSRVVAGERLLEPMKRLEFTRLGALLAEPEEVVPWLVEDRLPSSGLSILAGKPKAGKSTLARGLGLAVARGAPWLGWPTAKGCVFYLALEEKRAEVRAHFAAMGATDDDDIRLFIDPAPADALALLHAAAEQDRPSLIIVDPLLRLLRVRDGNDYAEVTRALDPVLALARQTGAHLMLVHHLGKGERRGGDAILGSTAFFATVDTALYLNRSEHYRTLASTQRYGSDLEEVTIELDPVTRNVSAGLPRKEADESKAAAAILVYLGTVSEAVEEPTILEAVEGRKAVTERALRRLVGESKVQRTGAGRKGNPYRYAVSASLPPATQWEVPEGESRNTQSARLMALRSTSRGLALLDGMAEAGAADGESHEVDPWAL